MFCSPSCSWDRKLGVIMKQTFNFSGVKVLVDITVFGTILGKWLQELPLTLKHTVKVRHWVKLLFKSQLHKYTILCGTTHTFMCMYANAHTLKKIKTQPHLQLCCSVVLKTELITLQVSLCVTFKVASNNDVSLFTEFISRNSSYFSGILEIIQRECTFSPNAQA